MARIATLQRQVKALALAAREKLELLGAQPARAFDKDETPCFGELIRAIDEADRSRWARVHSPDMPATA